MIISETTISFISFGWNGVHPNILPLNLDMNSPIVTQLIEKGTDCKAICKAFRELFDHIHEDWVSERIPIKRKWWEFYKSKYDINYKVINREFKLNLFHYINGGEPLNNEELEKVKEIYDKLTPETKYIIPFSIFR